MMRAGECRGYCRSAAAVERCDRRLACGGGEPAAGGRQAAVLGVLGGFHVEGVGAAAALPAYLPRELHKALARAARYLSYLQAEPGSGRW